MNPLKFIKKNLKYLYLIIICFLVLVPLTILIWSNTEYSYIYNARNILKNEKDSLAGYQLYLTLYPKGKYIQEAQEKTEIQKQKKATPDIQNVWETRDILDRFNDPTGDKMIFKSFDYFTNVNNGRGYKKIGEIILTENNVYIDLIPKPYKQEDRQYYHFEYKDNGQYLKLWFKKNGDKSTDEMVTLEFIPEIGYKFPQSFTHKINEWKNHKSIIRFKGFTTDNPNAKKYIKDHKRRPTYNKNYWVYFTDVEFNIQF